MTSSAAIKFPALPASKVAPKSDDAHDPSSPVPAESDETLMARICDGDRQAFAFLFRRYARVVRFVAWKVLRDEFQADDLLQEVFLSIFRKCKLFDCTKGSVYSWLMQITYCRAIDRRRWLATRHFYTSVDLDSKALDILDPNTEVTRCEQSLEDRVGKESRSYSMPTTWISRLKRETQLHFKLGA